MDCADTSPREPASYREDGNRCKKRIANSVTAPTTAHANYGSTVAVPHAATCGTTTRRSDLCRVIGSAGADYRFNPTGNRLTRPSSCESWKKAVELGARVTKTPARPSHAGSPWGTSDIRLSDVTQRRVKSTLAHHTGSVALRPSIARDRPCATTNEDGRRSFEILIFLLRADKPE